jgi:uncharacterized membrane protein
MGSLPWMLAGVVAAGVFHIIIVFSIPSLATRDAWARLTASSPANTLILADGKRARPLPFTPPDVVSAYCLYDLSQYNVIVRAPLPEAPWSLSVSTRGGENFYLVTGADAKKPEVRLLILRRDRLPEEASTEKTAEGDDQNIVVSPSETGIIAIRAPLRGESFREKTLEELRKAQCEVQAALEPTAAAIGEPPAPEPAETKEPAQKHPRRHRRH